AIHRNVSLGSLAVCCSMARATGPSVCSGGVMVRMAFSPVGEAVRESRRPPVGAPRFHSSLRFAKQVPSMPASERDQPSAAVDWVVFAGGLWHHYTGDRAQ